MKVREAISELMKLPPELEIMDHYAENTVLGFTLDQYDDDSGAHEFVACETDED